MSEFHNFLPITIRYSDIDAQGHVNNTRYGTYFESARLNYLQQLNLWDGKDFKNLGVIVADIHISYLKPVFLGLDVQVATRVSHIGNKSIKFEFQLLDSNTGELLSTGEIINVGYDYSNNHTVPISAQWRDTINRYEGTSF